jgi:hypothetical protein
VDHAIRKTSGDAGLNVSDWLKETHAGREIPFLCVYYDRFGFGMPLEQVEEAVTKLDTLLARGETPTPGGEIQIDRSGVDDGCIMIAFRPAANHASRYFDFSEDVANTLLIKLQEMLARAPRDGYNCDSSKGDPA